MESVLLYNSMRRQGIGPVSFTFTALLKACSAALDVNLGRQVHTQTILIGGFGSDLYVGNTLIDMYVKCGCLGCGHRVFDEMLDRDVISWTSLIVAYAKVGNMEAASELFDGLPMKDMVAWTAMVTGYAQNARPREALEVFERMQAAGVKTDEVTLVGVISACAQLGAAKYANWVRDVAEQSGFGPTSNVVVGSALIDMYAKCGSVEDAYKVFERMEERNVYSYSSMIVGFAMHGLAGAAMELFDEMLKTEIKPNRVTFIGVLTACSHAGMVEQAGRLEEALNLVKMMPMNPHGGVWGALLGACRIHGNPDMAQIAASHLFELEPNGIGNYILLSNIYASAGRWDDVSKEIKQALEDLLDRLKYLGYQPNLSSVAYDISDEEKKRLLMSHSEKLALAFGLLTTNAGCTIRIVKNLRICEDCHSVMCGASQITGREIVVRDNMRFHHFRDGRCSCVQSLLNLNPNYPPKLPPLYTLLHKYLLQTGLLKEEENRIDKDGFNPATYNIIYTMMNSRCHL
ncbi:Pentatricopeptide repeat-containing protein [Vitis vinifera]|uniref:Pentatricopeptide repeat-containing protein n=1 Tax=Vitis vinifera TaxID=29760 RepID=A0A438EV83_VITVI|nr:Pentatricopeptide repeat-containing protein [Vitis vinifera]